MKTEEIDKAIELLEKKRGFDVENIKKYDYIITDEDINWRCTEEELIQYADEQSREVEDEVEE